MEEIMNNKRIRYSMSGPGLLRSRRHFTTSAGQEVLVELNLNTKKYRILDSSTQAEVVPNSGNTKNLAVLKIQAKKGLEALGIVFADETRNRGNTELGIQVG